MSHFRVFLSSILACLIVGQAGIQAAETPPAATNGVKVEYRLPTDGTLPKTYLVSLAVVDAKNLDWIISQFAAGVPRTVTKENGGKFSETWDGLDDNFMPVPPGDYGVKGIFTPAHEWQVDGQWHAITPKFLTGASSWMPSPDQISAMEPFGGDPVGAPFGDVAVGPNGVAVFYYTYLENGLNNPMIDLKKPAGYDQFIQAFKSGGAGGGPCTATDGETVWSYAAEGGPRFVYRADGKPFGTGEGANRTKVYIPEGWVTAMAAWRDGAKTFVAITQRGKMVTEPLPPPHKLRYVESKTEFTDKVTILDGESAAMLADLPGIRAEGIAVQHGQLYLLVKGASGSFSVMAVPLASGLPNGNPAVVFDVPATITPADLEVDSRGRFYLSDSKANKVFQLDRKGKLLVTYGHLDAQKPGSYDPLTLMMPGKLATWVDAEGKDRLLIVENAGPNRVAEWADDGKLLRDFLTLQTKANDGYAIDPEHPEHLYIPGQKDWLTRFRVDYEKHQWTVDAVWPIGKDSRFTAGIRMPKLYHANGNLYLASARGGREGAFTVYRLAEDGWKLSAAILRKLEPGAKSKPENFFWHDTNGNGEIDDEELAPTEFPGRFFTYHGQNWIEDLTFLAIDQGGTDVWRVSPSGFDTHGNPIFKDWQKVLTDSVFTARRDGKADAVHGGNEMAETFSSDWMHADGSMKEGFFVQARGGKNFSANEGGQHKISRYVPDGKGAYSMKWRVGRTAMQWTARPGEIYGGMHIHKPINGLLGVFDQSRCGVLLYTEDGMYVDTLFPDGRRLPRNVGGVYVLPGEFFAGELVPDKTTGRILLALGKYTPLLFEADGWTLKDNPVRPLTTMQKTVSISATQIATPPEIALSVRGGVGTAKFARVSPALGEPAFDGSMVGWESTEPVQFGPSKDQNVEVRCLYRPDQLLLRWHVRMPTKFDPKALPPLERIFTHDQLTDTVSFYIQGDVNAKPGGPAEGRPGDARLVFGIFKNGQVEKPVAVGMYPQWTGKGASPQIYRTPVGTAKFAHVGALEGAQLFHKVDADGKGFVLATAIPRAAIPQLRQPFNGSFRTLINFEATLGGHGKFWWANSDGSASQETYDEPTEARLYPGSWAPVEFEGLENGIVIRNWLVCGPFGGPGAEKFSWNPNGVMPGTNRQAKDVVKEFYEAAIYPPDNGPVDLKADYAGDLTKGWWPVLKSVKWKQASIADLDTRVIMGNAAQVWYGATWIYAPTDMDLDFQLQSHAQTSLRWFYNGAALPVNAREYQEDKAFRLRSNVVKPLKLHQGWNQMMVRGYCLGYGPFRIGVTLKGAEEKLWNLRLSALPPDAATAGSAAK